MGACALDLAILVGPFVVALTLIYVFSVASDPDDFADLGFALLVVLSLLLVHVLACFYYPIFHAKFGWTPGKRALGLVLVSHSTRDRASKWAIVGRHVVLAVSIIVSSFISSALGAVLTPGNPHLIFEFVSDLFLLFAPMLFHPEGRGWHDLVAGTMVVRKEELQPATPALGSGW